MIIFFGIIAVYLGLIVSSVPDEPENKLPIHISPEDFKNGIAYTDLYAIDGVSQEEVIVVSGILEYDD